MITSSENSSLFDLAMALSEVMDMVSPLVADHQKRAAYVAVRLAEELNMPADKLRELILAGLVHDIGAFSLQERLDLLDFEFDNPRAHARRGYQLLKEFHPLAHEATIVLHHHTPWDTKDYEDPDSSNVPFQSHILHLADRLVILIDNDRDIQNQVVPIIDALTARMGTTFMPELQKPLLDLALKEEFWLNAVSPFLNARLREKYEMCVSDSLELDPGQQMELARIFSRIIDFRSHYTATHSCGVAATAETLAGLCGFPQIDCRLMKIAGYLHDMGKLAIPAEIIEKPARLSEDEYSIIKSHPQRTTRILEQLPDLEVAALWISQHHERLDGSGYPAHTKESEISLGSRVIAVADVFTAITEDRPYRRGMDKSHSLKILRTMADSHMLDREVLRVMESRFGDLNDLRREAQKEASSSYEELIQPFVEVEQ
jgi:HD-GYP domain-containing protein (c-di-GMP phosphodiesterase class II)